jgi:hypothetical protein
VRRTRKRQEINGQKRRKEHYEKDGRSKRGNEERIKTEKLHKSVAM